MSLAESNFQGERLVQLMSSLRPLIEEAVAEAVARFRKQRLAPAPTHYAKPCQSQPRPQPQRMRHAPHVTEAAQSYCVARESEGGERPSYTEAVDAVQRYAKEANCDRRPRDENAAADAAAAYVQACRKRGCDMSFAHAMKLAKAGVV